MGLKLMTPRRVLCQLTQPATLSLLLMYIHNKDPEWITDLNIKAKSLKLLEENIGESFYDFC